MIAGGGNHAGIDEQPDGDRHLACRDEVVKNHRDPPAAIAVHITAAVLEDHQAGGFGGIILRRNIHPGLVVGAREDAAGGEGQLLLLAGRNAGFRHGVRPELIVIRRADLTGEDEGEDSR